MKTVKIIVFKLEMQKFGLNISSVDMVFRSVEITQLASSIKILDGVINVKGKIIPIINFRKRFNLPEKEIDIDEYIILARTSKRDIGFRVDDVDGVIDIDEDNIVNAEKIIPGLEYVKGIVKTLDGLIFIHDLDTFLSIEEENILSESLEIK